jgi:hypothetical protein
MPFLKLRSERAYNTGAIRSPYSVSELARKLSGGGIAVSTCGDELAVDWYDERFVFEAWEGGALDQIGWLRLNTSGDIGGLSWQLARLGIRHRLELSRPRDLETDDVRCVTRYEYRWNRPGRRRPDEVEPSILTFDEVIER